MFCSCKEFQNTIELLDTISHSEMREVLEAHLSSAVIVAAIVDEHLISSC